MNQTLKTYICNGLAGFTILMLSLSGCSKKLEPTAYFNHFNSFQEESFLENKSRGLIYKLQYRPENYQALNALKGTGNINAEEVKNQVDSAGDDQMYCLRVELESGEDLMKHQLADPNEYYHRIELLNNSFSQMVWALADNGDTIRSGFHHFERAFKLRPFIQVMFSLNDRQGRAPEKIVFEDFIFDKGEEITFEKVNQYNKKLPRLSI